MTGDPLAVGVTMGAMLVVFVSMSFVHAALKKRADGRWLRAPMIDGIPLPAVDDPRWEIRGGGHKLGIFEVEPLGYVRVDGRIVGCKRVYWEALQTRVNERERARLEKAATAALLDEPQEPSE